MRISFDLDDTLICYQPGARCEPGLAWYWRLLGGNEPLRRGTRDLMRRLREQGWEIWIYTTSYRDPNSVRWWLWCHGVRVKRVINQRVHDAALRRTIHDYPPSKNPAAFGIDLHVDDSVGVRMEGEKHGFEVVVVHPEDEAWAEVVWAIAEERQRRGKIDR
jgi:hypothetical protein